MQRRQLFRISLMQSEKCIAYPNPMPPLPNFQYKGMAISSEIADGLHAIFGQILCGGRVLFGHDGGRVAGSVVVRIGFVAASHVDEKKGHGKECWRGGKWG